MPKLAGTFAFKRKLEKIKSEVHAQTGKHGPSEIGSGAEGVHEAIDDIVKAMHVMLGTNVSSKQ